MSGEAQARLLRVKEVFSEAAEADAGERAAILDRLCQADSELRREVEALLDLCTEPNLTLDRPLRRHQAGDLLAGRYRLTRFLASGGMGEVYAATDVQTGQDVALKFIRLSPGWHDQASARLSREVRMARQIQHPNVCRVFELEQERDEQFCVMELLDGETLSGRLAARGPFPHSEASAIALQLCDGLEAAHLAGVLHRDLKPGNIFLCGERAVIIDFGLAVAAPGRMEITHSLTSAGAVIGTLAYMAPEQLESGESSPASDVYSLGVVLYEMLTGAPPHEAKSPFRLAAQKARESHSTPRLKVPGLPQVWDEVVGRCLRARPEDRCSRAADVRRLLESGRPSARFVFDRWRRMLTVPIAAILAVALLSLGWNWMERDHQPPAEAVRLYSEAQASLNVAAPWRATGLLEQALQRDPGFLKARASLATVYAELDQIDKARDSVLRATATADSRWYVGRAERQSLDAARAAVMHDYPQAAQQYRRMAMSSIGVERNNALLAMARMQEQAGQFEAAQKVLESTVREDAGNNSTRVRYALLLCRKRDFGQAAKEFEQAAAACESANNPEGLADVLLARATALRTQSVQELSRDLERALELSSKTGNKFQNLSARFRTAALMVRERDYDGAIATARETAHLAAREGMLVAAAQSMGELGYTLVYLKRPVQAIELLQEAVQLAGRGGSAPTLAQNRLRLGEAMGGNNQNDEALREMEPAVQWYRQNGAQDSLPLILIKWGTVLGGTARFEEAPRVFKEALELATRHGDDTYKSMALARLGAYYGQRDLREAAQFFDQAVILARKAGLTGPLLQAALIWIALGDFEKGEALVSEAQRDLATNYRDGPDRQHLNGYARWTRARMALYQGRCDAGLREVTGLPTTHALFPVLRACSNTATDAERRARRVSLEKQLAASPDRFNIARISAEAGALDLQLGDWAAARRHGELGLANATEQKLRLLELDNLLVLRAAAIRQRQSEPARELTARVLQTAARAGFQSPERFNGRQDLLRLWAYGAR
ncbi:protein kinase domain-containing protein [Paludibaculum fermentans]|uniref:serine/threonine-protein kinase n=1 Tax=Paludibaculum fermentans TaxID=1473598 RepID=UPI003EBD5074